MKTTRVVGLASILLGTCTLTYASRATAQSPDVGVPDDIKTEEVLTAPKEDLGWKLKLTVGATGSYSHSSDVVGVENGATTQAGLLINSGATYIANGHEWNTTLTIKEQQTRTPAISSFAKSSDEAALRTTYLHHLKRIDWLGPYARLSAMTQLFDGYLVRADDTTVLRTRRDGSIVQKDVPAEHKISLTKTVEPLVLRESAGIFAVPFKHDAVTVKMKAGPGFEHIMVRDGYSVNDDSATPELELLQMQTSTQGGAELELEAGGKVSEQVTWTARANVFYPYFVSVDTDLTGAELLSTDVTAKLSVHLSKWASLDYVLAAKRVPLVVDAWQVQNTILFTAGFDLL